MQTFSLGIQSGELVVRGCQIQKLLFLCVVCVLLVLASPCHTLSAPKHRLQPLPPFLLALCSQSDIRKAEHLPQLLSCDGPKGPALVMYAKLH